MQENHKQYNRSLSGIPPHAALELYYQGIDPCPYLSVRGKAEFEALVKMHHSKPAGCLEAILELPGIKQIRELLPTEFKDKVKDVVRDYIGDLKDP